VGNVAQGFDHEFKRNYVLAGTTRRYQIFLLASVPDEFVVDVVGDGSYGTDKIAADTIERCALSIPAPEKSLNSADNDASHFSFLIQTLSLIAYPLV
jgi:hypothetical protein